MLRNYLVIACRNISRSTSYTVINVFGLSLGITCALLIFSLISNHLSFDNFHTHADRIYRFITEHHRDQVSYAPAVPPASGKAFREDYTFGEKVARICTAEDKIVSFTRNGILQKFKETLAFADPELFDIFNFPPVGRGQSPAGTEYSSYQRKRSRQ